MMSRIKILSWLTVIFFSWTLVGCSDTIESVQAFNSESKSPIPRVENISEVAPPRLIQELNKNFSQTKPEVKILSPQIDEIINSQDVTVSLQVKGLDIFKDEELGMGPHLHFFLDDQPYQAIYSASEPIILEGLAPGTHTIRVFASRPWHESFKNPTAYAQTTFHVFTATEDNNPSQDEPLLTYSRPQGTYGAEPIMLDFYLTNAPLHVVAQENPADDIADWRIRVTINGESFLLDTWQPIYLTGFNEGQNWVKLEYIDENGNVIQNAFNSTVRAINYDLSFQDTLAKLVTDKISLEKVKAIALKDYQGLQEANSQEKEEIVEEKVEEVKEEKSEIVEEELTPEVIEDELVEDAEDIVEPSVNEYKPENIEVEKDKNVLPQEEIEPTANLTEEQNEQENISQELETKESQQEEMNNSDNQ
ncbi:hypothetical protein [Cyanobacterium sp. Dongsha4]|uniref:hypothetical protein n=1 Tax=Cyanobacterium sp. DS4 TaxID=2878255 RepID=UPI002E8149BD|nr:hypothetical protein [Cyanobacterium sp. Dongsha4]WVL01523.1 DUF6130 family protein [Cyanobacterium sp. Dongsha4]